MILIDDYEYEATIFPDGCPQAWNLPVHLLSGTRNLTWKYNNLTEFWVVAQLCRLLDIETLTIWYLPFARQDKDVHNQTCFGLEVFKRALLMLEYRELVILDPHSEAIVDETNANLEEHIIPKDKIGDKIVIFPDKSAFKKYSLNLQTKAPYSERPMFWFEKSRYQQTGSILNMTLINPEAFLDLKPTSIIMIDDICDGGDTFILALARIKGLAPNIEAHLYTTYGIYSKGKQRLYDAGFKTVECFYEVNE